LPADHGRDPKNGVRIMSRQDTINRFMAVSYLYFQLTDKCPEALSPDDLADLLEIINAENDPGLCPDQHIA